MLHNRPKPKIEHQNRRNRPSQSPSTILQANRSQLNTARHGMRSATLSHHPTVHITMTPIPPESQSRVLVDILTCHPRSQGSTRRGNGCTPGRTINKTPQTKAKRTGWLAGWPNTQVNKQLARIILLLPPPPPDRSPVAATQIIKTHYKIKQNKPSQAAVG
jgi:hypothetical protein